MINKLLPFIICFLCFAAEMTSQLSILSQNEYAQYHQERINIDYKKLFRVPNNKSKKQITLEIFGKQKQLVLDPVDIMSADLVKAYPTIATYKTSTKDGSVSGRVTTYSDGIFMQLYTEQGLVTINPDTYEGDQIHRVEIGRNLEAQIPACHMKNDSHSATHIQSQSSFKRNTISNGSIKRTYTIAITTPYEFYDLVGESVEANIAGVVASVNALEEVYENELAVNFTLLTPVIFTEEDDPYEENAFDFVEVFSGEILDVYDIDEFDVAHFLGPVNGYNGGGYAALNALCTPEIKTVGYTGGFNGVYFDYINTFAHEVGHQFGANHTWNGRGGGCSPGNHSPFTAVELGSGSTIMSYNGLCTNSQNTNRSSSHFFHSNSVKEILRHLNQTESKCTQLIQVETGNEAPVLNVGECAGSTQTIPLGTPFMLRGISSDDQDKDNLAYSWEQVDAAGLVGYGLVGEAASMSTTAPLFETFNPSIFNARFFPEIKSTLGNNDNDFQVLPNVKRELNFNMITRDNQAGAGGMGIEGVTIEVSDLGPFTLDSLSATSLKLEEELEIFWSTNGTEDLCDNLAIYLSLNNGLTFDFELAAGIPYADGQATIVVPNNVPRSTFNFFMLACDDYDCIKFYDLYDGPVRVSTTCPTKPSELCDTSPRSYDQGSNELDLNLEILIGNNIIISSSSSCKAPANLGSTLGYTFIAIDQGDNIIKGIAEFGDFRNLQAGNYDVYGVAYKKDGASAPASLDANDWLRQEVDAVINSSTCTMISDNHFELEITGGNGCASPAITLGEQTDCDDDNVFTQEIIVNYDEETNPEFIVINDQEYTATGSPQSIILEGLQSDDPIDVTAYLAGNEFCATTEIAFINPPANCNSVNCGFDYENGPTELGFRPKRCLFKPQSLENIKDSEAYVINNLILKRKYVFSFCEIYDDVDIEARVVIMEYDSENDITGEVLMDQPGCTHKISLDDNSSFDDILIIITDSNDCSNTSKNIDFGQPKFVCDIGRDLEGTDPYDPNIAQLVFANVHIYPNPTSDVINIDAAFLEDYTVTISDVTGTTRATYKNEDKINLSALSAGLYFVQIHDLSTDRKYVKKCSIVK